MFDTTLTIDSQHPYHLCLPSLCLQPLGISLSVATRSLQCQRKGVFLQSAISFLQFMVLGRIWTLMRFEVLSRPLWSEHNSTQYLWTDGHTHTHTRTRTRTRTRTHTHTHTHMYPSIDSKLQLLMRPRSTLRRAGSVVEWNSFL